MSKGSAGSWCEFNTTEDLFLTSSCLGFCTSGESNLEALPTKVFGDSGATLVPLRRNVKVLIVKQNNFYWQKSYNDPEVAAIFTNL